MVDSGFRSTQRQAGIWKRDEDSFLSKTTPRAGQESGFKAMQELAERELSLVILVGETDAGKSFLLSGYINDKLEKTHYNGQESTARYMTFFDLELALRSAQTTGTMDVLFNRLVSYRDLVIDEFGRGKWSEFTSTFFENLLIRRHGEKKQTGIGTNLSGTELKEMLDFAVLRRIRQDGKVVQLKKN